MDDSFALKEHKTILAMIQMYCDAHHNHKKGELCTECKALSEYSFARLQHCPFQEEKPTCGNCTVHCYKAEMRERAKAVMRWAGPRMLFRHPLKALRHMIQAKKSAPTLQNVRKS